MARKSTKVKTTKESASQSSTYLEKLENEIQGNQSRLSLVLGALIVLVLGFLVFNYFNKNKADLGPSQNTQQQEQQGDVAVENLPGQYTVKEGDTLFLIAEKYYQDGYKYEELVKANNLSNADSIVVGQVLEIPKLETADASPEATPTATPEVSTTPIPSPEAVEKTEVSTPVADFGAAINGNTYTVAEGDWLSTIAARAYNGNVLAYQKIAQANNISNPDFITPGMVLTIPR